jgi:hypothetical protein
MPKLRVVPEDRTASASFTWNWEEAKALEHELPKLRKQLKEKYGIDNLRIAFVNPWGGVNHTAFTMFVEIAKGAAKGTGVLLSKWLLEMGRDFLKDYRKKHKRISPPKKIKRIKGKK